MATKILLGRLKDDAGSQIADGENLYLDKHDWACGWYWSFGYVGNARCHFHFNSLLYIKNSKNEVLTNASELFSHTQITDDEWWVIRDLFVQAYALQKAAEVYRHGGHQTTLEGTTDLIRSPDKAKALNDDLERVLEAAWAYTCKAINK